MRIIKNNYNIPEFFLENSITRWINKYYLVYIVLFLQPDMLYTDIELDNNIIDINERFIDDIIDQAILRSI